MNFYAKAPAPPADTATTLEAIREAAAAVKKPRLLIEAEAAFAEGARLRDEAMARWHDAQQAAGTVQGPSEFERHRLGTEAEVARRAASDLKQRCRALRPEYQVAVEKALAPFYSASAKRALELLDLQAQQDEIMADCAREVLRLTGAEIHPPAPFGSEHGGYRAILARIVRLCGG